MIVMEKRKNITLDPKKWVANYADYMYRYALSRVNNKEKAEDLVQDTFAAALKAAKNFKGKSSEKTWLFSILRNKIIDTYRAKSKAKVIYLDDSEDGELADNFFTKFGKWQKDKLPQNWGRTMENELITQDFFNILHGCLDKLNPKYATVFKMKYLQNMKSEEICKALDITSSNYWVIIHRAKLALRDCLENKWDRS